MLQLHLPDSACWLPMSRIQKTIIWDFYIYVFIYKYIFIYLFIYLFLLFRAAPAASAGCGSSQARGRIGTIAASLRHSHNNVGSEPHLRPPHSSPAMPDP